MAVVIMKSESGARYKGYYYVTYTLYVYCDQCGSFNIKKYIDTRKRSVITGNCVLVPAVAFVTYTSGIFAEYRLTNAAWFLVFALACVIVCWIDEYLWGDSSYKCRKCGNTEITKNHEGRDLPSSIGRKYNPRDYPSTIDVIDVPDRLTQKRSIGLWPGLNDP
jgi:hypothetical protein